MTRRKNKLYFLLEFPHKRQGLGEGALSVFVVVTAVVGLQVPGVVEVVTLVALQGRSAAMMGALLVGYILGTIQPRGCSRGSPLLTLWLRALAFTLVELLPRPLIVSTCWIW